MISGVTGFRRLCCIENPPCREPLVLFLGPHEMHKSVSVGSWEHKFLARILSFSVIGDISLFSMCQYKRLFPSFQLPTRCRGDTLFGPTKT